jgi:glycylpeptide N-tetradecanoyltransferase
VPAGLTLSSPNSEELASYLEEVASFLADNYVEDDDGSFRFRYRAEHIQWIMLGGAVGGPQLDLLVALRCEGTGEVVGFIAACPCDALVGGAVTRSAIIDFVCVHKRYRGRRLCPLLYQIVQERLAVKGIHTALKTTGEMTEASRLTSSIMSAAYRSVVYASDWVPHTVSNMRY